MLNVIIDSNIIIANYFLRYTAFSKFCKYFPERLIQVYVTEVSIEEIFKNYKNNYREIYNGFNKVWKELKKVSVNEIESKNIELEEDAVEKYKDYLYNLFNENNIKILPFPKVEHREIVKYSITGKKPFKQKDTGYKDFLIWHSALDILKESQRPLVIITKDSDFIDNDKVCDDFLNFLDDNNIDSKRLKVLKSINEFNINYLDEIIEKVDLRKYLEEYENAEAFIENFRFKIESALEGYGLDENDGILPQEYENPSITSANYTDFDTIDDVEVYDDEYFIITLTMRLDCEIEFFIFKADYVIMAEEDYKFSVIDNDWNKHYIAAYENVNLEVEFSIIIDKNLTDMIQIDVNEIRNYGY